MQSFSSLPYEGDELKRRKARGILITSRLNILAAELSKSSRWGYKVSIQVGMVGVYERWYFRIIHNNSISTLDVEPDRSLEWYDVQVSSRLCPDGCLYIYNNKLVE